MFEYALAERGTGMKKQIACPVCGFKRLVDADKKQNWRYAKSRRSNLGGDRTITLSVKNAESR